MSAMQRRAGLLRKKTRHDGTITQSVSPVGLIQPQFHSYSFQTCLDDFCPFLPNHIARNMPRGRVRQLLYKYLIVLLNTNYFEPRLWAYRLAVESLLWIPHHDFTEHLPHKRT